MMKWLITLSFAFGFLGAAAVIQDSASTGARDMIQGPLPFPDLQALSPFDLSVENLHSGQQRRLRLSVSVVNRGDGPLELIGISDFNTLSTSVTQHIRAPDGTLLELPVGSFIFHPTHEHWHLEEFAQYEVWALTRGGTPDELLRQNSKVSFCLRDLTRSDPRELAAPAAYTGCGREIQGISSGWTDTYRSHLPGQYVDITGLADGFYAVQVTFDPENLLLEANEENNSARVVVQIAGEEVRVIEEWRIIRILLDPRLV